jgi:hypothetical protein
MNSRNKGKVGEWEFAALLRENGFDARRGQQFAGGADSPDIVSRLLSWLHIEVKRCERIDMRSWVAQVEGDCGGKPWVIAFRWNHGPWLHAGRIDLLFGFLRAVLPPQTENFEEELQKVLDVIANRVGERCVPSSENQKQNTNQPASIEAATTEEKQNENQN